MYRLENDLVLAECLRIIGKYSSVINEFARDHKISALYEALSIIHDETRRAMWRIDDLKREGK